MIDLAIEDNLASLEFRFTVIRGFTIQIHSTQGVGVR